MKRLASCALTVVCAVALVAPIRAQTPGQMQYDQQQRDYWRQQEQQRQEQQRLQQLQQENARQGQGQPSPNIGGGGGAGAGGAGGGAGGGNNAAAAAQAKALRAKWEKQPPLPPDKNPLLGKWQRPASTRGNPNDPFAQLSALAKGGVCEVFFGGGGVFEFTPDRLMGMDARTKPEELDRVEYRGDPKHVVVIPKTTLNLIEFDFDGPNRISWTGMNCLLVRVGGAPAIVNAAPAPAAAAKASNATNVASAPAAASAGGGGGVVTFTVGEASPGNPVANRKLWVLKTDAQVALAKAGIASTSSASALQNWMHACQARAPECEKGALALKPYSVGLATTDSTGHAKTPPLPAGRYWVLSDAKVDNKHLMWNQPLDVKGGELVVTLDRRNAMPVD